MTIADLVRAAEALSFAADELSWTLEYAERDLPEAEILAAAVLMRKLSTELATLTQCLDALLVPPKAKANGKFAKRPIEKVETWDR
jgi:hypothetical protein